MDIIGPSVKKMYGQLRLKTATNTLCTTAGQFYKLAGEMENIITIGFVVVDNKLKYAGPSGTVFQFSGVSDLQVDKACDTVFTLYLNGAPVPESQTPHTFVAPSKTGTISTVAIISLNQDDELEIWAKSSEASTTLLIKTLNFLLWS